MDNVNPLDILLGIFYLTAAASLVIVGYLLLLKRFKKAKLEALNSVSLITSRENVFSSKTRFLVISPDVCHVKINLLDENEEHLSTLVDYEIREEEFPFDFEPSNYKPGKYYLYLEAENATILRAITIVK